MELPRIQDFFRQLFVETARQAKSRLVSLWNAVVNSPAINPRERMIRAALLDVRAALIEDWSTGVPKPFLVPIKLLTRKITDKAPLTTREVCLLLVCCRQYLKQEPDQVDHHLFVLVHALETRGLIKLPVADPKSCRDEMYDYIEQLLLKKDEPEIGPKLREFLDVSILNPLGSKGPKVWVENPGLVVHFDEEQVKMFKALDEKNLGLIVGWTKDPASLAKLKGIIGLKSIDKVYFPGESSPTSISFIGSSPELASSLDLLRDKKIDLARAPELRALGIWLIGIGRAEFKAHELTDFYSYIVNYVMPVTGSLFNKIDLEACTQAIRTWEKRESWSPEEGARYQEAMMDLYQWYLDWETDFPKELLDLFPKLREIMSIPQEELEKCAKAMMYSVPCKVTIAPIAKKIQNLMKDLPGPTEKKDRLKLSEFYFLKAVLKLRSCPFWLRRETFQLWKDFAERHLMLPTEEKILVSFANPKRDYKLDRDKMNPLERVREFALNHIFGRHVYLATKDTEGVLRIRGISHEKGEVLKRFMKPRMDVYELNLDQLARDVPEELKSKFKELFPQYLERVAERFVKLDYPSDDIARIVGKLLVRPKKPPSEMYLTKEMTTSFCSEFVMRCIVEATEKTFQELKLDPPKNAGYYGLRERQNLEALLPNELERRMRKQGLIRPLTRVDQIINNLDE